MKNVFKKNSYYEWLYLKYLLYLWYIHLLILFDSSFVFLLIYVILFLFYFKHLFGFSNTPKLWQECVCTYLCSVQVWSIDVSHTGRCSRKGNSQDPVVQESIRVSNLHSKVSQWASRQDMVHGLNYMERQWHLSASSVHKSLNLDGHIF